MKILTKNEIENNHVDTIEQFKILKYIKKNIDVNNIKIFLINENLIKIIDEENEFLYFSYDNEKRKVVYFDELSKDSELVL